MKLKMLVIMALILFLLGCAAKSQDVAAKESVTMFKSPACGCCNVWGKYMESRGFEVSVEDTASLDKIKDEFKIPQELRSCHTARIMGYFVEGHIPTEAIEKLILEKPDIAGIAMPGMPPGSPGMPGKKSSQFVIYAVSHDGTYKEFMRL